MYSLEYEQNAVHTLKRLNQTDYNRIILKTMELAENPRPRGCRKLEGSVSDYQIRIGDWRVIYEVDDPEQTVRVLRIVLRKDAYR